MTGIIQTADIEWRDGGVPASARFDDPYFSMQGGLAETEYVFLAGNDLPARFSDGFQIAELGFGTGLNLLATCRAAARVAGRLRYTTFEAFPMALADMARALTAFPDLADLAAPLLTAMGKGKTRFALGNVDVELIIGDARVMLPHWQGKADAWFLDGFSPAKNPELWGDDLMAQVARHTAPGGTFATYTAAGHVRRALATAGFAVARLPGYGNKRHMSAGRLEQSA